MRLLAALVLLLLPSHPLVAQTQYDEAFAAFLQTEIWPDAQERGVPRETFVAAFEGVRPNLDLPDLKLPGSGDAVASINFQAEFRNGADYLSEAAVGPVVRTGRAMLRRHAAVLARIEDRYGVPAPIVVAIWGRESAFGRADIPHDVFEVLGTKAWASRRKAMFRKELLAALEIAARDGTAPQTMRSSWAGALGQPQFMPSKYLEYAVDFDGDGTSDIWNSVPDTLASIAHYLKKHGWRTGRDWGFEAVIPEAVSCAGEGPDMGRPIASFVESGVRRVSGRPFPDHETDATGHLMMPAGRDGPAFVATPNFYVLKAYNNSDLYALFVGHVADRMMGAPALAAAWAPSEGLTRGDVADLQKELVALGYDVGGIDGLAGFKTRRAIGAVERERGLAETCWPSAALVRALGEGGR